MNLVQNPDAPSFDWAVECNGQTFLIASAYEKAGDRSLRFVEGVYQVVPSTPGRCRIGEKVGWSPGLDAWRARFAIPQGYDYPQEVSAHLSGPLLLREYLGDVSLRPTPRQEQAYEDTKRAFRDILRLEGE